LEKFTPLQKVKNKSEKTQCWRKLVARANKLVN